MFRNFSKLVGGVSTSTRRSRSIQSHESNLKTINQNRFVRFASTNNSTSTPTSTSNNKQQKSNNNSQSQQQIQNQQEKTTTSFNSKGERIVAATVVERPAVVMLPPQWQVDYMKFELDLNQREDVILDKIARELADEEMRVRSGSGPSKTSQKKQKKADEKPAAVAAAQKKQEIAQQDKEQEDPEAAAKKALQSLPGGAKQRKHILEYLLERDRFKKQYPLVTPADKINDRKALYRKLTNRLYLIVKKNRSEHSWQFPQGGWEESDGLHLRKVCVVF